MDFIVSNDRSIIQCNDPYYGLTCTRHQITKDDKEVFGRPRAEMSYSQQGLAIGDTVSYKFMVLVPDDIKSFNHEGEPTALALVQFHQNGNIQPGVPFALNVFGDTIRCSGYYPDGTQDGRWFDGIYDTYIPNEWLAWEIKVKWSYGDDGFYKVNRDGQRVYERTGPNCVPDPRGVPWFRWGPHQNADGFESRQMNYVRYYFRDVVIEKVG